MKFLKIFMAFFFFLGILLIAYPVIATYVNDTTGTYVITDYNKLVDNLKRQQAENQQLFIEDINEKFSNIDLHEATRKYIQKTNKEKTLLDKEKSRTTYNDGEILGYISIPKIKVELPIYEGTNENVLYKGVGRYKAYSLITGENNTHAVLTGHSGYSTATLFDNLDLLEVKDIFYIHYYDEIHKYIIDNVNVIKPEDGDAHFLPAENYSYVTLVTCTPKTINTHRLLVRGIRVPNDDKNTTEANLSTIKGYYVQRDVIAMIISVVIMLILIIITQIKRKKHLSK